MTDLLAAAVNPQTASRYAKDLQQFLTWVQQQPRNRTDSYLELDALLIRYFTYCFDINPARGERQKCVNARAAILLWHPNAKMFFRGSERALLGWERRVPPAQKPPCPVELVVLLVKHFVDAGKTDMALVTWLCFHGYLRINEALNVRAQDITFPKDNSPGGIRLPQSKTGINQSVMLTIPELWVLLRWHVSRAPAGRQFLFPNLSGPQVARELDAAVLTWGPLPHRFLPHTLRHGGATNDFLNNVPMDKIIHRGRWASPASATRYIQQGRAMLIGEQLPAAIRERAAPLINNLQLVLANLQQ
jgi:integrase